MLLVGDTCPAGPTAGSEPEATADITAGQRQHLTDPQPSQLVRLPPSRLRPLEAIAIEARRLTAPPTPSGPGDAVTMQTGRQ